MEDGSDEAGPTPHESIHEANAHGVVVVQATASPEGGSDQSDEADSASDVHKGEPVDIASGQYVEDWLDFSLRGTLALECRRVYRPGRGLDGPLGRHRTSLFDASFKVTADNRLMYRDERGRRVVFPRPFNFLGSGNSKYLHLRLKAPRLKTLDLIDGGLTKSFVQGKDGVYRLMAVEDANGNKLALERSGEGRLIRADHSDGFALAFRHDDAGRRTDVTLHQSGASLRLIDYAYDTAGNLVSAICSTTFSVRYVYDAEGRLAGWCDETGRSRSRFDCDRNERIALTRTTGPWHNDSFSYDQTGGELRVRYLRGDGSSEEFVLDAEGNLSAETDGRGGVTRRTHQDGYVTSSTDSLGNRWRFAWDGSGNQTDTLDPEGRRTITRWSGPGVLVVSADGGDGVRRFEHDEQGNVVVFLDPLKRETRFEWTPAGRLCALHRADGTIERHAYDAGHRIVARTDAAGGITRYERDDPFGRVTAITDAAGNVRRYVYGKPAGRSLYVPDALKRPDGVTIEQRFDREGQVVWWKDGEQRTTRFDYGAFDQLVAITAPGGGRTTFGYDVRGGVVRIVNAKGGTYAIERDGAGGIVGETDFDGRRTAYRRDAAGRVVEQVNADGSRLTFAYDRAGAMIERCAFPPEVGLPEEREQFRYDGRGAIVWARNRAGTFTFDYDKAGQLVRETAEGVTIESSYDQVGRRIERRLAGVLAVYGFDATGAMSTLSVEGKDGGSLVSFERDALGRELHRLSGGFRMDQSFDSMGRIVSQCASSASGGDALRRRFVWNAASEPTVIDDSVRGRTTYAYDDCGRVNEVRHAEGLQAMPDSEAGLLGLPGELIEVERFSYDEAGDIAAADHSLPGEPLGRPLTAWTSTQGGRLSRARGPGGELISLEYDRCGRVTKRTVEIDGKPPATWCFRWNALDRLTACDSPSGETWTYRYDPFGRRTSKRRDGGDETVFVWDRHLVAALMKKAVPTDATSIEAMWHYEPETDRAVLQHDGACGIALHVVVDHLGTPRELMDNLGRPKWSISSRLWGGTREPRPKPPPKVTEVECPLRFPGQWADNETGLNYNVQRYYDPETAQYLSCDPLRLRGGLRLHAYVGCPTAQSDPLGTSPKTALPSGPSVIGDPNALASASSSIRALLSPQTAGLTLLEPGTDFVPTIG